MQVLPLVRTGDGGITSHNLYYVKSYKNAPATDSIGMAEMDVWGDCAATGSKLTDRVLHALRCLQIAGIFFTATTAVKTYCTGLRGQFLKRAINPPLFQAPHRMDAVLLWNPYDLPSQFRHMTALQPATGQYLALRDAPTAIRDFIAACLGLIAMVWQTSPPAGFVFSD